jgi:hypothetical protein
MPLSLHRRIGLRASVATAAALVAFVASAGAEGAIIGTHHMDAISSSAQTCSANPSCTYVQVKVPGGDAKAQSTGRVKTWRVSLGFGGKVQLVVAKRLDSGKFKVLRTSPEKTGGTAALNKYSANLRIKKGQFIGVNLTKGAGVSQFADPGAERRGFVPAIPTGTSVSPSPSYSVSDVTLKLNATIRH